MKNRIHSEYYSSEDGVCLKIEALTADMEVLCGMTIALKANNISVGKNPAHPIAVYDFESTASQGEAIRLVSDVIGSYTKDDRNIKRYIHAMILGWFAAEEWKAS